MNELFIIQNKEGKRTLHDHLKLRQLPYKVYIDTSQKGGCISQSQYILVCYQYVAEETGYSIKDVHEVCKQSYPSEWQLPFFNFILQTYKAEDAPLANLSTSIRQLASKEFGSFQIPTPEQLFFSPVNDGTTLFIIHREFDKKALYQYLRTLTLPYRVYVEDHFQKRSIPQNSYLWVCYTYLADAVGCDANEVHEVCKALFLLIRQISLFDFMQRTTTVLSAAEFQCYTEAVKQYAYELGVAISEPEKLMFKNADHSRELPRGGNEVCPIPQ